MIRRALGVIFVALLSFGCSAPEAPPEERSFELRPVESFQSPQWTGTLAPSDPVVATVEGTPITLSMLKTQLELAGPEAKPAEILERMIEFELLAREAFNSGKYTDAVVGSALRRALTRRWIEVNFDEELTDNSIPDQYVQMAYKHMRARFNHFDRFVIADAQILCCKESDMDSCYRDLFDNVEDRRSHRATCAEFVRPEAEKMAQRLSAATSRAQFKALFDEATVAGIPDMLLREQYLLDIAIKEYDFQYDTNTSYEKQFEKVRYHVFYKEVMEGAKKAWLDNGKQTPTMSVVLETELGFHILFIEKVIPEKHLTPDDPAANKEIREHAYTPWRKVFFRETMERLCGEIGCEINHDRLVPLQKLDDQR